MKERCRANERQNASLASGGRERVHWSEECDKCCKALWGPSRLIRCCMNERPFADVLNAYATTNHLCLKMALRHPSAAPLQDGGLPAAVTVIMPGWSLTPDQRGALLSEAESAPVPPSFSLRPSKCTVGVKDGRHFWFKAALFLVLNTFYCQTHAGFSGITPRCKGQNKWRFEKYKKKKASSCHRIFKWKMWQARLRLLRFCQTHFPQIIPFMVDWLRTLRWRFPYLTRGGLRRSDWMFF